MTLQELYEELAKRNRAASEAVAYARTFALHNELVYDPDDSSADAVADTQEAYEYSSWESSQDC